MIYCFGNSEVLKGRSVVGKTIGIDISEHGVEVIELAIPALCPYKTTN